MLLRGPARQLGSILDSLWFRLLRRLLEKFVANFRRDQLHIGLFEAYLQNVQLKTDVRRVFVIVVVVFCVCVCVLLLYSKKKRLLCGGDQQPPQ